MFLGVQAVSLLVSMPVPTRWLCHSHDGKVGQHCAGGMLGSYMPLLLTFNRQVLPQSLG